MPADSLRVTPRGARCIVAVVIVFALAVLVSPVVHKARIHFARTRLVKLHVGVVGGLAPELGVFRINGGEKRHVGRVEITRVLAV